MDFSIFPKIKTKRLNLTELNKDDSKVIFFLRSDSVVCRYLDHPKAESIKDAEKFIGKIEKFIKNNESIMWAIRIIDTEELAGTICLWNFSDDELSADIGFVLNPIHQGKGLMSEAVEKVLDYGFSELKLNFICGEVDPLNIASIKLMEKHGFALEDKKKNVSIYRLGRAKYLPKYEK